MAPLNSDEIIFLGSKINGDEPPYDFNLRWMVINLKHMTRKKLSSENKKFEDDFDLDMNQYRVCSNGKKVILFTRSDAKDGAGKRFTWSLVSFERQENSRIEQLMKKVIFDET